MSAYAHFPASYLPIQDYRELFSHALPLPFSVMKNAKQDFYCVY